MVFSVRWVTYFLLNQLTAFGRCSTVETAEIRQKKGPNRRVESVKLSGVMPMANVKVPQFNSSTSFFTIAETLPKQASPVIPEIAVNILCEMLCVWGSCL